MKPWKPEYVDLLRQSIEEYRNVDFIDNRGRNEGSEPDLNLNAKLPLGSKRTSNSKKIMNSPMGKGDVVTKRRKNFRINQIKPFVDKEDKVLRKAIRKGKEGNITLLARKLNRPRASVRDRIEKIKTGVSTREYKTYTLQ